MRKNTYGQNSIATAVTSYYCQKLVLMCASSLAHLTHIVANQYKEKHTTAYHNNNSQTLSRGKSSLINYNCPTIPILKATINLNSTSIGCILFAKTLTSMYHDIFS